MWGTYSSNLVTHTALEHRLPVMEEYETIHDIKHPAWTSSAASPLNRLLYHSNSALRRSVTHKSTVLDELSAYPFPWPSMCAPVNSAEKAYCGNCGWQSCFELPNQG